LLILVLMGCAKGRKPDEQSQNAPARSAFPAPARGGPQTAASPNPQTAESSNPQATVAPASQAPAEEARPRTTVTQSGRAGVKTVVRYASREWEALKPHNAFICMFAGSLPEGYEYSRIANIVVSKGSYGGTDQVLQAMADEGRRIGIDAVIGLQSRRRHSSIVWKMSTPISKGELVKLKAGSPPLDCEKAGGKPI
jgi:hypothetical protein